MNWYTKQLSTQLTKLMTNVDLSQQNEAFFKKSLFSGHSVSVNVGAPLTTFVATGNFISKFCSDLQQESGFVILAEKLNHLRYTAHFRFDYFIWQKVNY